MRKWRLPLLALFLIIMSIILPMTGNSATLTVSKQVTGPPLINSSTSLGSYFDVKTNNSTYLSVYEGSNYITDVTFASWEKFTEGNRVDINQMDIVFDGKTSHLDDDYDVYLWDYQSNSWTTAPVGSLGQLQTSDTTVTVSITDPTKIARYVDDNGNFQVRIKGTLAENGAAETVQQTLDIDLLRVDFAYIDVANDTTPPTVSSTTPASGAGGVEPGIVIKAGFNERLEVNSVNSTTVKLHQGANQIIGAINYNAATQQIVFTPGVALSPNKLYTVTLTTGVTDLAGNGLAANYSWSFTIAAGSDMTKPTVAGAIPPGGTTGVSPYTSVEVEFSEDMNESSIANSTFYLKQGSTTVPTSLSYDSTSKTAVLVPTTNLSYSTTYTATVTTGVKDLAGNALASNYTFTFTTAATPSGTPASPTKVLAQGIGSTEIAINWVPVDLAEGYRIYRSSSANGTYTKVGEVAGQLEAYWVDSNLAASTRYYYQVSAYNTQGESSRSTNASHTYTNAQNNSVTVGLNSGQTYAPQAPRGVNLTPGPNQVKLNWNANPESNIQGYNVYRAERSGASKGQGLTKLNSTVITGITFVDLTTVNYYDYYYRVSAVDNTGAEGNMSAERFMRIEERAPAYVPHKDFATDTSPCATCHVTHVGVGKKLIKVTSEPELCFSCHDGTGSQNITYQEFTFNHYVSRHPVPAGANTGTMECSDCHNPHLDAQATNAQGQKAYPKLLQGTYNGATYNKGNQLCYTCHGEGSTKKGGDHATAFEGSIHNTAMPNPESGTDNKCANCHEPHAAPNENLKRYKEENACFACHYPDSISPDAPDIYARMTASPDSESHHDVFNEDQAENGSKIECQNCHNPHGLTKTYKNTDPDNPAPGVLWKGTMNDFCFKCHDGTYTSNGNLGSYAPQVTPGAQNITNIKDTFSSNDKHGSIDGQPKNLDSSMGYDNASTAPNYVMDCTVCHEPHGTANGYNLRTELKSLDGTKTKRGLLAYTWKYNSGGTITTGSDARFFCNGCHGRKHMGNNKSFPTDCFSGGSGCHSHGKKF